MKYAPIVVLAILALGIFAVTVYRPHGPVRATVSDNVIDSALPCWRLGLVERPARYGSIGSISRGEQKCVPSSALGWSFA